MAKGAGPGLEIVEGEATAFAGRPPAWSEDAEISVLGAMMIDGDAVPRAVEILGDGEGFYKRAHRLLYQGLRRLHQRGQEPDVVALEEELKASGDLENAGGMRGVAELVSAVPTSANVEHHARIVAEKAALRELQEVCRKVVSESFEAGPGEAAQVVEDARAELEGLAAPGTLSGVDLVSMADWMEDPDALAPPERIAHGIVYRRQNTLVYADPKSGKTTLAVGVTAAVSSGTRFMSRPTLQGPVLYVAAEGDRGEILRRLHELGAEPANVDVVVPGASPVAELRTLMDARDYRLVVLDTLGRWMAPLDVDRWKQSDVDTVLTPLERIVRESEAGLLALHHANAEGKPIDSTGFAAWADVLRKVEDGQGPRERVVTGLARFTVPDLRFRLVEGAGRARLVPVDPDREMEERVLEFLEANPGASKRAIRDGLDGGNTAIDDALEGLMGNGIVERDTSGRAHTHRIAQDPHRHATGTVEARSRHGGAGQEGEYRAREGGEIRSISPSRHGPPDSAGDDNTDTNRCEGCGRKVGPTSTLCGRCKREGSE